MSTPAFGIGDIVTLKSHPYFSSLTNIIVSGDSILHSPLLVVKEIHRTTQDFPGKDRNRNYFKYRCTYFSSRNENFQDIEVLDVDIKLIQNYNGATDSLSFKRGDRVRLSTTRYELTKKRSSLSYEDNDATAGNGKTMIHPLLSFISPVMQVVSSRPPKNPGKEVDKKTNEVKNYASLLNVKCSYFNPSKDGLTIQELPIEALELVEETSETILAEIQQIITTSGYIKLESNDLHTIIKARHLVSKVGDYYLRGFDLLQNKALEVKIDSKQAFLPTKNPYITSVPSFNITADPTSISAKFIMKEFLTAIESAQQNGNYIRIKYKNRNDQLSYRTLKDFKLLQALRNEKTIFYLTGFCLTKQDIRHFKLKRIQSLQILNLHFKEIDNISSSPYSLNEVLTVDAEK